MCVCVCVCVCVIYYQIICYHENNVPPVYHRNSFVTTHAHGHMMYGYTFLAPMNQRVLNKLNKEHNISGHKGSTTHRVLKSHRIKMSIITYMFS